MVYPSSASRFAAKVPHVAVTDGWAGAYPRAAYFQWFVEGKPNGTEENLQSALTIRGQEFDRVLTMANASETQAASDAATETAKAPGAFGILTFAVGSELIWGDDHLEDAIAWGKTGGLACWQAGRRAKPPIGPDPTSGVP
jgi:2-hydroxychromene-2-carboxylate isomerase